jgi:hypothetical protein
MYFVEVPHRRWLSQELSDALIQCAVEQQVRAGALDALTIE